MKRLRSDRHFTLLFVPEGRKNVWKWFLPAWVLHTLIILLAILMLSLAGSIVTVCYLKKKVNELHYIEKINKVQAEHIRQLETKASLLQEKVEKIDTLDSKVRSLIGLDKENKQHKSNASRSGRLRPREQMQTLEQIENTLNLVENIVPKQERKLETLAKEIEQHIDYQEALPSHWPVRGPISSPFGERKSPFGHHTRFHEGIDIAANYGAEVQAAGSGRVIFAGWKPVYGKTIIIDHGYGFTSFYGHNSKLMVSEGDKVHKGEVIARVGSSGLSTGPHLHFQISLYGQLRNPLEFLNGEV